MWRDVETDHLLDTKQLEPGGVYTWTRAVHHGAGQRWHWVAYPYKLGLGVEPNYRGEHHAHGTADIVAEEFTGDEPNWSDISTHSIPLIFPGLLDWTDLTNAEHARAAETRNAEITMWELYENDPTVSRQLQ